MIMTLHNQNIRLTKITFTLLLAWIYQPSFAQKFTTQSGGHCFSLDIPDYLTKTYQLNDVASLQYMNAARETYVMVIEDAKDHLAEVGSKFSNSEDFLQNLLKDYPSGVQNKSIGEVRNFKSNKNEHSQVELTWDTEDNSIYMIITSVETSTHFYKIMCWTLLEYKEDYKEDYLKISKSLSD
jgi:hypothetical protein